MQGLLGDIVVCPQVAAKQAKAAGHSRAEEILLLTTHGILHLLGYDHAEPEERRRCSSYSAGSCSPSSAAKDPPVTLPLPQLIVTAVVATIAAGALRRRRGIAQPDLAGQGSRTRRRRAPRAAAAQRVAEDPAPTSA